MLLPKFLSRKISPEKSLDFLSQKSVLRPALSFKALSFERKIETKTQFSNPKGFDKTDTHTWVHIFLKQYHQYV